MKFNAMKETESLLKEPNKDLDANEKSQLLNGEGQEHNGVAVPATNSTNVDPENPTVSLP